MVAQVKAEVKGKIGRPVLQRLTGIGAIEKKRTIFFSLSGYSEEAQIWGGQAGMALFEVDLSGRPCAVNAVAAGITTLAREASADYDYEDSQIRLHANILGLRGGPTKETLEVLVSTNDWNMRKVDAAASYYCRPIKPSDVDLHAFPKVLLDARSVVAEKPCLAPCLAMIVFDPYVIPKPPDLDDERTSISIGKMCRQSDTQLPTEESVIRALDYFMAGFNWHSSAVGWFKRSKHIASMIAGTTREGCDCGVFVVGYYEAGYIPISDDLLSINAQDEYARLAFGEIVKKRWITDDEYQYLTSLGIVLKPGRDLER